MMHISEFFAKMAESDLKIREYLKKHLVDPYERKIVWATLYGYGMPMSEWADIEAMPEEDRKRFRDIFLLSISEAEKEYRIDFNSFVESCA